MKEIMDLGDDTEDLFDIVPIKEKKKSLIS